MLIQGENYKLYNGDCLEVMDKLIKEGIQVDLTVTSPPYDDLRDYEKSLVWNFDVFKQVVQRLYDITKDGGVVVWVVGDKTKNGSKTLTSFNQALYFKSIGFNMYDVMIYEKNGSTPPHKNRYMNTIEFMFVLSKGKPSTVNLIKDKPNKWAGTSTYGERSNRGKDDKIQKKSKGIIADFSVRGNVWRYATGFNNTTSDKFAFKHPAIFPEKLAQDHIISWSNEGDIVLDCFMGSGTTGKMALLNNRKFIGIEKVEDYFEISKQRMSQF